MVARGGFPLGTENLANNDDVPVRRSSVLGKEFLVFPQWHTIQLVSPWRVSSPKQLS